MSFDIDLAFRARIANLIVAQTSGEHNLSSLVDGYERGSGSFLADGFHVGMEVTVSGFTNHQPAVIREVTAGRIKTFTAVAAQSAASGRSMRVTFPSRVGWENTLVQPLLHRHFAEVDNVGQPSVYLAGPAANGRREDRGVYVVRWYGVANTGARGLRLCVDALAALFTVGTSFATAAGSIVRVRGDAGPSISQAQNRPAGFALLTLSIPWRRYAANAVLA